MIRQTPNSFVGEEAALDGIDSTSYADIFANLIDQLSLLQFTFGCDKVFLIELDHELRTRAQDRSLRDTMSATCISLRPALIDTILRGKVETLDHLILYADQINALYQVPLQDNRLSQTLVESRIVPKNDYHATPLHMMSFLETPWSLDVVDLLHKHGANLNFQDDLGRTPLHTAVQAGAWLHRRLSDIVDQRSMPTIDNGIINPRTPFLKLCQSLGGEVFRSIQEMHKPCIVLSSAVKYGTNQLLREKLRGSMPLGKFLESAARAGEKSLWAMAWSLRSAHANLSNILVNGNRGSHKRTLFRLKLAALRIKDKELSAVLEGLTYIQDLISRLLGHGAEPIVIDNSPSKLTALDIALNSGRQCIIFDLLNSLFQRTGFKLSFARTAAEKSEVLQPVASLLARLIYREIADLDTEHVLDWLLFFHVNRGPSFIFGSKSVNLLEMYTDEGGSNAMHVAAAKRRFKAVGLMISLGFKKDVLDALGRSPWDIAKLKGRLKVLFMLMSEGERKKRRII
jgi:ankyrin repeat protein